MSDINDFREAMKMLREDAKTDWERETRKKEDGAYMSDTRNWCCVHATKYMPSRNADGQMFIATTAMATNYEIPRPTVHTTLNHIVGGHAFGNWDDCPYVIFFPYNDTVAINGEPLEVSMFDTFFIADPDRGLVLPKGAYLVRPSNDCLYSIGETEATYKTDNFTEEEIKQILSMNPVGGYQEDWPQDKKIQFLRKTLRDTVVKLAMKKKGYEYITCDESDKISVAAAQAARSLGLKGDSSNKGHSSSFIKSIEMGMLRLMGYVNEWMECADLSDEVYKELVWHRELPDSFTKYVQQCIVKSEPVDLYDWFVKKYDGGIIKRWSKYSDFDYESVQKWWPMLDKMMHRCSDAMAKRFMDWLDTIKRSGAYEKFHHRLGQHLMEDTRNQYSDLVDFALGDWGSVDVEKVCNNIMEAYQENEVIITHLINCIIKSEPLNWHDFYMQQFLADVKCPDGKTFAEYYKYMHQGLIRESEYLEDRFTKFLSRYKEKGVYDALCARLRGQMQSMQYSAGTYNNMERR